MRFVVSCMLALLLAGLAPQAHAAPPAHVDASKESNGPSLDLGSWRINETLKFNGTRLETPNVTREELEAQRAGYQESGSSAAVRPRRNIAAAIIASAVLPGMGELYVATGSKKLSHYLRVPVFIALDAYFWYSYRDNYDKGKEVKAEYEMFGDEHWSEERFLLLHPFCTGYDGCDDWEFYNENGNNFVPYFVYIPRHLDHEEYYENMGKYDNFVYGWDDWDGDYDNLEPWTPNRTTYWAMRLESDDYLLKADRYVMALIINRTVSMLDAGWLAYRYNKGKYDDGGWTLDLRPGMESSSIGLSYRF